MAAFGLPRRGESVATPAWSLPRGGGVERLALGHGRQHGAPEVAAGVPGDGAALGGRRGHEVGDPGVIAAAAPEEVRSHLLRPRKPRALGGQEGRSDLPAQVLGDHGAVREAGGAHSARLHQRRRRRVPTVLVVQGQPRRWLHEGQVEHPLRHPDGLALGCHRPRRLERCSAARDRGFLREPERAAPSECAGRRRGGPSAGHD
mmetsp:Transcript_40577/g.116062  ORF Transcript_40577/g.116062 Transcript_40577/m.116062 type:complete len:203 (+) Transcript_40577:466-1074(+)